MRGSPDASWVPENGVMFSSVFRIKGGVGCRCRALQSEKGSVMGLFLCVFHKFIVPQGLSKVCSRVGMLSSLSLMDLIGKGGSEGNPRGPSLP
jgi:hypothetical protein